MNTTFSTMHFEHLEMEVTLNGEQVPLEDTHGYGPAMDMLSSIRRVIAVFGQQDAPAIITINDEYTYSTTVSKADDVINNWCRDN